MARHDTVYPGYSVECTRRASILQCTIQQGNHVHMTHHRKGSSLIAKKKQVIIPAGVLRSPFMNTNGPAYFYYGSIGWLIGHQITVSE